MRTHRVVTRGAAAVLAGWGAVLLARPERVVQSLSPGAPPLRAWVVRVLGARMLVQHALLVVAPVRPLVAASATVDGIHAVSMLVMAASIPDHRRVTLVSAGVAGAATLVGVLAAPRPDDPVR